MLPHTYQSIPHPCGYQYILFQYYRQYTSISKENQIILDTSQLEKFLNESLYRWIDGYFQSYIKFLVEKLPVSLNRLVKIAGPKQTYPIRYQFTRGLKFIVLCTYKRKFIHEQFSITSPLVIFDSDLKLSQYLLSITDVRDNIIDSNTGGIIMVFSEGAPDDLIDILNKNIEMREFDNFERVYYINITEWGYIPQGVGMRTVRPTIFGASEITGRAEIDKIVMTQMKKLLNQENESLLLEMNKLKKK